MAWQQFREYRERVVYIPENGIDRSVFAGARSPRAGGPLRVVWVGRLVPLKGVDMLVEAAAPLVGSGRVHLDIVGDGPEMPRIRQIVEREQIAAGVEFPGWVEQREAAARMGRADVLAFPSIREFGGGVVLEAMALGLAPVVVDYGGPSELISDETGYRVPMGPRHSIVARFREVLTTLAAHPELAAAVGEKARRRVERWFTWEAKVEQVIRVYQWVLGRGPKPAFGMPFPDEAVPGQETGNGATSREPRAASEPAE